MVKTKDECANLEELKKEYEKIKNKYNLLEFSELNESFDIEEVCVETDFLLKRIRGVISEKIAGYLRFIETILNPSAAPMFFFKLIKKLDSKDKEILGDIYEALGDIEVRAVYLDLNYSEKNESEFIKESFEIFNKKVKPSFLIILEKLSSPEDKKRENNGNYFG